MEIQQPVPTYGNTTHRKAHDPFSTHCSSGSFRGLKYPIPLVVSVLPHEKALILQRAHSLTAFDMWDVVQSFRAIQITPIRLDHLTSAFGSQRQCRHPPGSNIAKDWQEPIEQEIRAGGWILEGNTTVRLRKYLITLVLYYTHRSSAFFAECMSLVAAAFAGVFGFPEYNHTLTDACMIHARTIWGTIDEIRLDQQKLLQQNAEQCTRAESEHRVAEGFSVGTNRGYTATELEGAKDTVSDVPINTLQGTFDFADEEETGKVV